MGKLGECVPVCVLFSHEWVNVCLIRCLCVCVCALVCVGVCALVWVWYAFQIEKERETAKKRWKLLAYVCVCLCVWLGADVCVCERERERQRVQSVCVRGCTTHPVFSTSILNVSFSDKFHWELSHCKFEFSEPYH